MEASPTKLSKRVLLADSDEGMRNIIRNFLNLYFDCDAAASSDEARQFLREKERYDLVLADTQLMPMNGVTFASTSRQNYPELHFAVMTRSRVEDLFPALNKARVFNVLVKSAPFQFDEFQVAVENLLFPSRAIGLARYLREPRDVRRDVLASKSDRRALLNDAVSFFRRYRPYDTDVSGIRLAFEEQINNAIFHGFRRKTGLEKYRAGSFAELEGDEQITLEYGRDKTYLGCSVTDNQGMLDVNTMMSRMERQISLEGLMDESGRGMYLTRTLCDRMIINVKPGQMTQIILLFAHRSIPGPKPLYVNLVTDKS